MTLTVNIFCLILRFFILSVLFAGVAVAVEQTAEDVTVRVGDTIQITLPEDASFAFSGLVTRGGTVTLPYLGDFVVADRRLSQIQSGLAEALNDSLYIDAKPQVSLVAKGVASAYVFGAVREPGAVDLPASGNLSVIQALARVKGLTSWANPERAYIMRPTSEGSPERIELNLRQLFAKSFSEDAEEPILLLSGDELYIDSLGGDSLGALLTSEPMEVIVVGQVSRPGVVSFAPGEEATLLRAIFKAGGLTRFARGNRIKLIRYAGAKREVEELDVDIIIEEGFLERDRALNAGDMLIVPQKFINL